MGVSGVDGGIIQAEVRDSELGYVGRVTGVDAGPLEALALSGCLPVLSPIAASATERELGLEGVPERQCRYGSGGTCFGNWGFRPDIPDGR